MADPYARIFLLSHMRACTSLAGHILGSHPRINGYFELHIGYEDAGAADRQLALLQRHETLKPDSRYLFDKLLHNDYPLRPNRLGVTDISLLVTLQAPDHAIRSIVDLFAGKGTDEPYAAPVEAARYYVGRLQWLAAFCRACDRPYHYYDAELFQLAPERLLDRLAAWLALDTPLSERYQLFSRTGEARSGDSSALIRSGRILRQPVDYSHIHVPADTLDMARAVYRDCRATIIARAADAVTVQDA